MTSEELRETLVRELVAAGDAARAASESTEEDLPQRVHRFRKALRRARATLDLLAEALPRRTARAALRTFRDARRALGDARDHTVVPHVVGELVLDDAQRVIVTDVLVAAGAQAPDPTAVEQTLRAGCTACVAKIEEVTGLVGATIGWRVPRAGLRRVYRDAREARMDAKHDQAAFHVWRRRTKELAYQLEVLVPLYPAAAAHAQDLEPVLDAQSAAVDLIMLVGFLEKYGEAEGLAGVIAHLEQQTAAQMKLARRAGRAHFHAKPKAYVREIRQGTPATTT